MKNWIEYYRKSILDGLKREIKDSQSNAKYIDEYTIHSNTIPLEPANDLIDIVERRINRKNGITIRDSQDWEEIHSTDVLISPFTLTNIPNHDLIPWATAHRPFYFLATLTRSGQLRTPEEMFPIFQRKYLEPVGSSQGDLIISTVEIVDLAMTVSSPSTEDYDAYIDYINKVFKQVTAYSIDEYAIDNFVKNNKAAVLLPDEDIYAAMAIVALCNSIIEENNIHSLHTLSRILETPKQLNQECSFSKMPLTSTNHLGQMTSKFPLSPSQRVAMNTLDLYPEEKVLAINGPPGTGKTTILQSIVANEVVKAALEGGDAPIILACSNNNQAVTNILDSYTKVESANTLLANRWLTIVKGYGCYLSKKNVTENELIGYNYQRISGTGLFQIENDHEKLASEKKYFLYHVNEYLEKQVLLHQAPNELQNIIIAKSKVITDLPIKWSRKIEGDNHLKTYLQLTHNATSLKDIDQLSFISTEKFRLESLERDVKKYFDDESFWIMLFCLMGFGFAKRKRTSRLKSILRESHIDVDENNCKESYLLNALSSAYKILSKAQIAYNEWNSYLQKNQLKGTVPEDLDQYFQMQSNIKIESQCIYDHLDKNIRSDLFHLSIHYWEARWLLETECIGNENKGKSSTIKKWKRRAMLTPCFVSTYYMAPKFFGYSKHIGRTDTGISMWTNGYLFNFIDLLLVDEAGQVSPEIGIPSFSLAKKTIVVGDVKQIEPIWNIPKAIDRGNLEKYNLSENIRDDVAFDKYDAEGRLCSKGSIMKLALSATSIENNISKEKGLFLNEHRRCYDEIILYCNALAYKGKLRPMKGSAPSANLFAPMLYVPTNGDSESVNKSRMNPIEAEAIVLWLRRNKREIEMKYGQIENHVGIITPFVAQKFNLTQKLKKAGFDTEQMTIGTVHSLQGAERELIIFSAVYSPNDVGTMFFDYGVNMLNVAVSRAKDSFICFASEGLFDPESSSPSGILMKHLQT